MLIFNQTSICIPKIGYLPFVFATELCVLFSLFHMMSGFKLYSGGDGAEDLFFVFIAGKYQI